jgi:hypothetical protein
MEKGQRRQNRPLYVPNPASGPGNRPAPEIPTSEQGADATANMAIAMASDSQDPISTRRTRNGGASC